MQNAQLPSRPRCSSFPRPALTGTTCCPTWQPWSTRVWGGSGRSSCRRRSSSGPGEGGKARPQGLLGSPSPTPDAPSSGSWQGFLGISAKLTLAISCNRVFSQSVTLHCARGLIGIRDCETGLQPPHHCLQDRFCFHRLSGGKLRHTALKPLPNAHTAVGGGAGRQPGSPSHPVLCYPPFLPSSLPPAHTGGLGPPGLYTLSPFSQGGARCPGAAQRDPGQNKGLRMCLCSWQSSQGSPMTQQHGGESR